MNATRLRRDHRRPLALAVACLAALALTAGCASGRSDGVDQSGNNGPGGTVLPGPVSTTVRPNGLVPTPGQPAPEGGQSIGVPPADPKTPTPTPTSPSPTPTGPSPTPTSPTP